MARNQLQKAVPQLQRDSSIIEPVDVVLLLNVDDWVSSKQDVEKQRSNVVIHAAGVILDPGGTMIHMQELRMSDKKLAQWDTYIQDKRCEWQRPITLHSRICDEWKKRWPF